MEIAPEVYAAKGGNVRGKIEIEIWNNKNVTQKIRALVCFFESCGLIFTVFTKIP